MIKSLECSSAANEWPAANGAQLTGGSDRRRRIRTDVHWPVCFLGGGETAALETTTENLSSIGFHCLSPVPLIPGEVRVCMLKVPSHRPENGSRTLSLECRVRIVRVESAGENGTYGVACAIEDYRFLPAKNQDTPQAAFAVAS